MTFRIDKVTYPTINAAGDRIWHWHLKGIEGRGIYGSLVTDRFGRGVYLLAEGDHLGFPKDWAERMTCIVSPDDFEVSSEAGIDQARDAMASVLLRIGWGPQVVE